MQQFGKSANAPGADTLFLNLKGTFGMRSSNNNLYNTCIEVKIKFAIVVLL